MKKSAKILGVGLTTSLMMLGVLDLAEATSAAEVKGYTMYRLYNPNNGEHFYTKNTQEQQQLVRVGWKVKESVGLHLQKGHQSIVCITKMQVITIIH